MAIWWVWMPAPIKWNPPLAYGWSLCWLVISYDWFKKDSSSGWCGTMVWPLISLSRTDGSSDIAMMIILLPPWHYLLMAEPFWVCANWDLWLSCRMASWVFKALSQSWVESVWQTIFRVLLMIVAISCLAFIIKVWFSIMPTCKVSHSMLSANFCLMA